MRMNAVPLATVNEKVSLYEHNRLVSGVVAKWYLAFGLTSPGNVKGNWLFRANECLTLDTRKWLTSERLSIASGNTQNDPYRRSIDDAMPFSIPMQVLLSSGVSNLIMNLTTWKEESPLLPSK
jgi:hypothetical protein